MQEEIKRLREELEVMKKGIYDEVTCNRWTVVDKNGKERITAFTNPDGNASVSWYDKDAKLRISAATLADGYAGVGWFDNKDEKVRILAATFGDGNASVTLRDSHGKMRIKASTLEIGLASVHWYDKHEKLRISAATHTGGATSLPTKDLKLIKP